MTMAMASVYEAASGLATAVELIKAAMAAGDALDRADLKFKLAEALNALADARISVADAKEELSRAYKELDELDAKLKLKDTTVRVYDAYYSVDEDGGPKGDPYCSRCWETEHTLIHLVRGERSEPVNHCPACKQKYARRSTPFAIETRETA